MIYDKNDKQITKIGKKYVSLAKVDIKTLFDKKLTDFVKWGDGSKDLNTISPAQKSEA